jgi:hypothetical protein
MKDKLCFTDFQRIIQSILALMRSAFGSHRHIDLMKLDSNGQSTKGCSSSLQPIHGRKFDKTGKNLRSKGGDIMHKIPTPKQQFPLPVMHAPLAYRPTLPSKSGSNTSG